MFLKEKGFYISLVCGIVAVVAVSGLCMNLFGEEEESPVALASPTPVASAQATPQVKQTSGQVKKEKATATPKVVKKVKKTSVKPIRSSLHFNQQEGLLWPVKGDVLMEYSADRVIYFKTLAQYRTNPAIIIGAKEGTDVKASADGVVTNVTTSEETGRTVTMSIGDGFTVSYGQLQDVAVGQGDSVTEGQVIGKIAKPSKYYAEEGSNLYYQVKENKQTVNPMILLR